VRACVCVYRFVAQTLLLSFNESVMFSSLPAVTKIYVTKCNLIRFTCHYVYTYAMHIH